MGNRLLGWLAGSLAALLLVCAGTADARADVPRLKIGATKELRLGNGLHVVIQEDHRQPLVAVLISYGVGSRDERTGYAGLAHLVEHLAFRGSRHVPPYGALLLPQQAGATYVNALTSADATTYAMELPSRALELALWIESDRMAFALEKFDKESFQAERDIVQHELERRGDVAIDFWRHLERELYPKDHPYYPELHGRELLEVGSLRLEHAQYFFQWGYRPDNAKLVIVGDVEVDRAARLVEKYFAPVGNPSLAFHRQQAAALAFSGTMEVTIQSPTLRDRVAMIWPVPRHADPSGPAIELAARVLSDSEVARLDRVLSATGLAHSVLISYAGDELQPLITIEASAGLKQDVRGVRQLIDNEIERLSKLGVTQGELASVKRSAVRSVVRSHQHLLSRAGALAHSMLVGGPLHDPNREIVRLMAVSADELRAAVRAYLPLDRRLVGWLDENERAAGHSVVTKRKGALRGTGQ